MRRSPPSRSKTSAGCSPARPRGARRRSRTPGSPTVKMSDGPNGVRGEGHGGSSTPGVVVPSGITLGAIVGPAACSSEIGELLGTEAPPQGRPHPARTDGEHPPHTRRRPHVRVLQRGPRTVRRPRRRVRARRAVEGRRRHGQALRLQRHRDGPHVGRRAGRRPAVPRDLPPAVRAGRQGGRRLGDHERLQPPRRRALRREPPPAHRHPPRRVGLRRLRRVRLVRRAPHDRGGQRRAQPRDARAGAGLRRQARRRGERRRGRRGAGRPARARPAAR